MMLEQNGQRTNNLGLPSHPHFRNQLIKKVKCKLEMKTTKKPRHTPFGNSILFQRRKRVKGYSLLLLALRASLVLLLPH